jgi:hypothetical protein
MIFVQLSHQLAALRQLLGTISTEQYTLGINHLGNASIGGHTRHIIELLQCAIAGYYTGQIDYVNRQRDLTLEQDSEAAMVALDKLTAALNLSDQTLQLFTESTADREATPVTTTYYREIVYNTEHTIHHLALIKVALIEMQLDNIIGADFGMAYSTLKYKATLMQTT